MRAITARVVKLVDTRDLKSLAGNSVPVQVRPRAPSFIQLNLRDLRLIRRSFLITNRYLPNAVSYLS